MGLHLKQSLFIITKYIVSRQQKVDLFKFEIINL